VPYEELTHTADVSLRAWGATLDELFQSAACGLFALMGRPAGNRLERHVALGARDGESLMVDWLSELLYLHETNGELYDCFEVHVSPGWALSSTVYGGAGEVTGDKVKAITYHGLNITCADGVYSASLVFDT
jgi:SHS2 domain-containing protein